MEKNRIRKLKSLFVSSKAQKILLLSLFGGFLLSSVFFVFFKSNFFPILNGLFFLTSVFLFKGKFRIYSICVYVPFAHCMTIMNSRIGSFATWVILIYALINVVEKLRNGERNSEKQMSFVLFYCALVIFAFISEIINFRSVSFSKFISVIAYWAVPLLFLFDDRGEKKLESLIILFASSILGTNLFCFPFIYLFRQTGVAFLSTYVPVYASFFRSQSALSFRFPGLFGDPNLNGFIILLASSFILLFLRSARHKKTLIALLACLQIGGILGQSKTYFILLIAMTFVTIATSVRRDKLPYAISGFLIICLTGLLILPNLGISGAFERLFNIDTRISAIESVTTGRLSIFISYFTEELKDPITFFFGHGIDAVRVNGTDYHNAFAQLLWELGVGGTVFFVFFFSRFASLSITKKRQASFLPLLVILIFSFSLQIAYSEVMFVGLFLYSILLDDLRRDEDLHSKRVDFLGENYEISI